MGPEIPVWVAPAGDAQHVSRLIGGFRDFYEADEPPDDQIRDVVGRLIGTDSAEYLLAGDPPSGVAQLRYRLSVWTGAEDAWLEDLFIEADTRGRGLGRALAEACVARARARGCKRLQLDANERNKPAIALYRDLGFGTEADRWEGGRDLYFTLGL